ncbi:phage tail length tape measure family protein [Brucella rhizosphaerae]|uniref:Prophage tail length tape measure family protein n=1 Tax=Brucella rhizosphaerae TaxID=571254 RepID=A0A256FPC9_9HYPH|nr:phage tail length tape measure family protein [Brucella rhizosphaerae]OYR16714.1 prophage tail length tape measure family protein [Brucella rhizosphaerae]
MTIQLSSLRVAADFDPTAYKRGMDQKVAADKAGAESSKSVGAALAQADAAMERTSSGSVRLSRALIDGYANAAKFESTMRSLGRSVDRGMGLERAGILLDGAYKKYGLVADAMNLVKQGHVQLAPLVTSLNQRLEIQAAVAQRASEAAKKLAAAQASQMSINSRLGVVEVGSSIGRGDDVAAYGRELDGLRAKFSPLFAASQQYNQVVEEIQRAHAVGAISTDEMAAALQRETLAAQNSIAAIRQRNASMAQASQMTFNQQLGVLDRGNNGARESDVIAYGRQLDGLRAKYNPLYAAIQQYKMAQSDIRQAHAVGAISVDEMTAALNRERKAALDNVAALKQRGSAVSSGPKNYQTSNIAAQFQDIAVTNAMGMSPIQIALQQGTQLSAVFNEMGKGRDVIRGIGSAFLSIISPVSLATIGVIAGGSALAQYLMSLKSDLPSVEEAMKRHSEIVQQISQRWPGAADGMQRYLQESTTVMAVSARENVKVFEKAGKDAYAAFDSEVRLSSSITGGAATTLVDQKFKPFEVAINNLRDSVKSGRPDFDAFYKQINEIVATDPKNLQALGDKTIHLADAMADADRNTNAAKASIGLIGGVAAAQTKQITELTSALVELSRIGVPQLDQRGIATQQYQIAVNRAGDRNAKDDAYLAYQAALTRIEDQERLSRLPVPGDKPNYESIAPSRTKKSDAQRSAERDANAYRDLVKSAQDRIDQMGLEEQLVGKTGVAADAYRMQLELIQKAQDKGRTLSEDHKNQLIGLADSYGKAAEKVAALTLAEELRFEREQLFRNPTEQRVSSTLRSSGIDPLSSQGQLLAGQIRMNEQLAENRDMALSFGQSLVSAFDDGKISLEEMGKAGMGILDRLIDKMLTDLIDAIMQVGQAGSGMGGGGGILGGLLGGLFGGGGGGGLGYFPPVPSMGVGLYAKGGVFPGGLKSFSGNFTNQVVSKPTTFAFAKGVGLMGEAGAEAIMPLTRGSDGSLGVRNFGRSSGSGSSGDTGDSRTVIMVQMAPDLIASILEKSGRQAISIVQSNEEARQNRQQNGE